MTVTSSTTAMLDIRCHCGRLLCRMREDSLAYLELKCPRCHRLEVVQWE